MTPFLKKLSDFVPNALRQRNRRVDASNDSINKPQCFKQRARQTVIRTTAAVRSAATAAQEFVKTRILSKAPRQ